MKSRICATRPNPITGPTAIAVGPVIGFGRVAQMRDFIPLAFCHLPDGLAVDGLDLLAVQFKLDLGHSAASFGRNSSGKYLITVVSGFEAAWPRPQIEASRIAWLNSSSSSRFQTGFCINSCLLYTSPSPRD